MKYKHATNRITAIIAIFAMLMLSLAPSISSALNTDRNAVRFFAEVCSSDAKKSYQQVDIGSSKTAPDTGHHGKYCGYCTTHAGKYVMPAITPAGIAVVHQTQIVPELFYLAPTPLFAWSTSQPRAPPQTA